MHIRQLARGLVLYLVLPNLAFYLLGLEVFINRVYVNTDYLLLWAASPYLPRLATGILYALLLDLDLVLSTESIYHFTTAETIVMARELLQYHPLEFYVIAACLLLIVTAALILAWRWGSQHRPASHRGPIVVALAAVLISGTSVLTAKDAIGAGVDVFAKRTLTGSAILETILAGSQLGGPSLPAARAALSASGALFAKSAPVPRDIVLILVESQGLLRNADDMRRNLAPLLTKAIRSRYAVETGGVRFLGGTMFGELRALCRIYAPDTTPLRLPNLDRCLPNLLRARGYDTVSYHGYWRWFYERQSWYPVIGFERSHFAEDLLADAPPAANCGSMFKGVCDLWIADKVEAELATPGRARKFIYWLTLNSHLPVEAAIAAGSRFDCAGTETLKGGGEPCNLARIHYQLYERIARIALDPRIPPTRFIIVGDHSPPFPALEDRNLYDQKEVPYVELAPKAAL